MVSPKWAEPTFGHLFNFEFSIAEKDEIGTYFHNPEPHLHLPPKPDILVISISYSPSCRARRCGVSCRHHGHLCRNSDTTGVPAAVVVSGFHAHWPIRFRNSVAVSNSYRRAGPTH
jgi:hypothetical protein